MTQLFHHQESFTLESGVTLPGFYLSYTTWGKLNTHKDNVVWIFHALTASSDPADWWPGLVGPGHFFDPEKYFIVCVNMPGSCYGSFSPLSINETNGEPYYHEFPFFTTRDMIRAYQFLKRYLKIDAVFIGIGGSMGGQQLLEWAIEEPTLFKNIIPIATNAKHSAWGQAFNATQRMCLESDPSWQKKHPDAGNLGLAAARAVALLSYRHYNTYGQTQTDSAEKLEHFKAESYQRYQGEKLVNRFTAFSYWALTKGMDSHNVGRGRISVEKALQQIKANTLVIGINSDVLFPPEEQSFLAQHIPDASLQIIHSEYGHDGFLLEYTQLEKIIGDYLTQNNHQIKTNLNNLQY